MKKLLILALGLVSCAPYAYVPKEVKLEYAWVNGWAVRFETNVDLDGVGINVTGTNLHSDEPECQNNEAKTSVYCAFGPMRGGSTTVIGVSGNVIGTYGAYRKKGTREIVEIQGKRIL
jgi:hypothetical protein